MSAEDARVDVANAIRNLSHAFVAHEADEKQLTTVAAAVNQLTDDFDGLPRRDRMALMRAAVQRDGFPPGSRAGFEDRAVAGHANPTGVDIRLDEPDGDDVVARVTLRQAFEGAPGRAHGGIVAAVFDDVTGFVIGRMRQPSFTGELTVRYVAPVPVNEELEMRARLVGQERRKIYIEAEAKAGDTLVATCKAIYIAVDPSMFAGAPDPR
jgi:acyl-coenzyme A thioesterase PaaI-like protein